MDTIVDEMIRKAKEFEVTCALDAAYTLAELHGIPIDNLIKKVEKSRKEGLQTPDSEEINNGTDRGHEKKE